MAYTDDAVLAKLSALNESHESIASAAQWIMFHRYANSAFSKHLTCPTHSFCILIHSLRRHADRTVALWHSRLKDSPSPKRLNLIYLANGE